MRQKLGLQMGEAGDVELIRSLLDWMQKSRGDFTNTFRDLSSEGPPTGDRYRDPDFRAWYARWQLRLSRDGRPNTSVYAVMRAVNPAVIPRNHRVEEALFAAEHHDDLSVLHRLLAALASPYEARADFAQYQDPPPTIATTEHSAERRRSAIDDEKAKEDRKRRKGTGCISFRKCTLFLLPFLVEVGTDHRLADPEPLKMMLGECEGVMAVGAKRPERSMAIWTHLAAFFLLAYALTWTCWLPLMRAKDGRIGPLSAESLATLGQFGPFAAALVVAGVERKLDGLRDLFRRLFKWKVNPVWYGVALLLPPILALAAIAIQKAVTGDNLEIQLSVPSLEILPHFLSVLLVGGPLGEELGWRGFALPRLQAISPLWFSTLLLALAWAGWHLPLWWVAETPSTFGFYVVGVIPLTFLFTWLSVRSSGSVLIAMLFHASINTCIVRLPLFAAFVPWTALLWIVAAAVVLVPPIRFHHLKIEKLG